MLAQDLWGVLQISFYAHLWVTTYAWSLIAPNLHISLFQSVTMHASLLHAKKKSAASSFNNRLKLIYRAPLMCERSRMAALRQKKYARPTCHELKRPLVLDVTAVSTSVAVTSQVLPQAML